jgi:hypothetical protein
MPLFKEDKTKLSDLSREARRFLNRVRKGAGDAEAAAAAGVRMGEVRSWLRDPGFAHHYELARQGTGGPQCISMASIDETGEAQRLEHLRGRIADMYPERDKLGLTDRWRNFIDRALNG